MAWKPKEKQLTPEEAVALARQELAPFWLGTGPLLAGVRGQDGKATAHPLDNTFEKKPWLMLFADLMDFSGEALLQCAREWLRRYSVYNLNLMLVAKPTYSFFASAKDVEPLLKKRIGEGFIVVLDQGGLILDAFAGGKMDLPAVRLFSERKVLFERSGVDWMLGAEDEIQKFLRLKDPGLPLSPRFELAANVPVDSAKAELGARDRSALFSLNGKISQQPEGILVQDPSASIRFVSPYPRVSIIAQSTIANHEPSRMRIELNGDSVFDGVTGADLTFGDDGGSEVKVGYGRLHHLLHSLPAKSREITLRFPDSDRLPVAVYGARFSSQ